jgi:hypothetical protein
MNIAINMLLSLGTKLLTEKLLEELLLYILGALAKSTKTKVDNELLDMVKKHLGK